jgi:2-oxoglutarate/2-oxoacid ferredoxin oxidoreductase subunit alpha
MSVSERAGYPGEERMPHGDGVSAVAELREGSEVIADAMVAAGCRFFSGYPMTPFTEVLEHMAAKLPGVGGTCMNAESELEAVGMAWGAAATGTPSATGSTGQGLSLMQESLAELCLARVPLVVLNMARAQGDYWQATRGPGHGDARMPVLAPMDVPEAGELTQLAFHLAATWRSPVLLFGDYYLAHTSSSASADPTDFGPAPDDDWSLDGSTSGSGRARLLSPLGTTKRNERGGYDLAQHYSNCAAQTDAMLTGIDPLVETAFTDDADVVVVAFGTPAKYVRATVSRLRTEGVRVGYARPITLLPFPSAAIAAAVEGARRVAVYENNTGQMVDDVRLAVEGRVPVEFIGRLSLDGSGFGIAPDLDSGYLRERIEEVLR